MEILSMESKLPANERIPLGCRVRYHGANAAAHGEYLVDDYYLYAGERVYDLWPAGVARKGNRGSLMCRVRPKFLTVLG